MANAVFYMTSRARFGYDFYKRSRSPKDGYGPPDLKPRLQSGESRRLHFRIFWVRANYRGLKGKVDNDNPLVMNGATFAGIIQKGKIAYSADGPDRHGGLVKDIEAQNIDLSQTHAAYLSGQTYTVQAPATASAMNKATLGGYTPASRYFRPPSGPWSPPSGSIR
jgi:hypothetical protein